jgi:hypothetical protein
MRNQNYFFFPTWKILHQKDQIINDKWTLQYKLHLASQSRKIMFVDFFSSCGIEEHVHNSGKPCFEIYNI